MIVCLDTNSMAHGFSSIDTLDIVSWLATLQRQFSVKNHVTTRLGIRKRFQIS